MMRSVYLVLCVLGLVLPMSAFVPWLAAQPIDAGLPARFVAELFSTRIGAFFGWDVIVSAVVLFVFVRAESRRLALPGRWWPVVGTLLVGVSFGLPLFLYLRERALGASAQPIVNTRMSNR